MMYRRLFLAAWLAALTLTAFAQPTPQPVPSPAAPATAPGPAPVPPPPSVTGTAWLLMDYASGQILAGENIHARVEPASITKVMTSYVVAAEMAAGKVGADDQVQISENAWRGGGAGTDGSTSFLPLGSRVRLQDLLHGMIVQSGNDASIALAEHVAGSHEAFAALMNEYARKLGMNGTHFVNAHGLPHDDHYTTAHDIALMAQAMIRDFPEAYAYHKVKEFTFNNIRQHNRNTLLWRDDSVDGIKTGHTSRAGYCLLSSAKRGDQRLIAVVMGSTSEKQRADDSQALLNWGFRFFETHQVYAAGAQVAEYKVWKGATDQVRLGVAQPVLATVPRGRYEQVRAEMDVPTTLVAPIAAGQPIGTLRLRLDDRLVVEQPLVALEAVPEGGFFRRLMDEFWMWWASE
jgi:D-alanyl-D-alanine carboxypeptidase (penicillin-binding protein 5/6)|nr:D-alanyl-D-alanine carboxypeptidase family protein [Rehaibacterium terrae]